MVKFWFFLEADLFVPLCHDGQTQLSIERVSKSRRIEDAGVAPPAPFPTPRPRHPDSC